MKIRVLLISFAISLSSMITHSQKTIRYLPIGDSYTIGEGISPEENFPSVLAKHLRQSGIKIEVVRNPARTGWTTKDAIDKELPLFRELKPDFSTLLIGVNDWVQEVNEETFQKNLSFIIDEMQKNLSKPDHLILVTIPDFSATPNGGQYGKGRNISEGIAHFNSIVVKEAKKRKLPVVEIFSLSQEMKNDPSLIASDGLHPSGKEYAKWEELIYPVAEKMLSRK